jgi:hypothetical protein
MTKLFALICWLLWATLIATAALGAMHWAIAAIIGGSVYALWHLYRQAAVSPA